MALSALRGGLPAAQRPQTVISTKLIVQQRWQPPAAQPLLPAVPSGQRCDRSPAGACSFVPRAFAIEADGSPLFSAAAEGAPVGDGFGSEREVNSAREQAPQHEAGFVDRLRAAAGQAAARAGHAAAALRSFTLRLATLVAKSVVLGVTAQLAQRQRLQKLAAEQRQRAQAKLVAATAARQAAQDQLRAALAAHSRGDRAFVKMLLSQDNPARTLEDKWGDLSRAMRGDRAPELRKRTAQLFSAALDSSQAVQQAIATEAAKGSKALDRLVSQHGCVEHEEALRAEVFAQILQGS